MKHRNSLALAAAALMAALPLAAAAQIAPGMQLTGTIDQTLNSANVQVGQPISISGVSSQDGRMHNATIYGHVDDVQRASQGRAASISIAYDTLRTRSGHSYALQARTVSMVANTKNNAVNEAGGALAGMILGNIIGKKLGTNAGGLVGAGGGYLYAKNAKQNLTVPANSLITVQVLHAYRQP